MGKAIESIAKERGHEIVLRIDADNIEALNNNNLQLADVAIEFTNPDSAIKNITQCFDAGIPTVCGTTGWLEHWDQIKLDCENKNATFLYASNFSVGVNLFFELNKKLAQLMNNRSEYECTIEEIHHTAKKDAPSGTAITIAENIIAFNSNKNNWVLGDAKDAKDISITSKRIDPAPGTHIVSYNSSIDNIEIKHTAHNRIGFATGAVLAAEFVLGKKGLFNMGDVLSF
jgi:4-hydroxy-tetrahydrodipicolinate reductase